MRLAGRGWVGWAAVGLLAVVGTALLVRGAGAHLGPYLANLRLRPTSVRLDVRTLGSRLLIVAPHPDDEIIGAGGLIQQAVAGGARVYVALMTNGDGFQSDRALLVTEEVIRGTAREHLDLGRRRQEESLRALAEAGVPAGQVTFLGYPDGGVHALWQPPHWSLREPYWWPRTRAAANPYRNSLSPGAPYSGAQVLADVLTVLRRVRPTALLTVAPFDVQRDHWATYDFVRLAAAEYAGEAGGRVPIYCFLIHRGDWPAPEGYHPDRPLSPPAAWARRPDLRWFQVPLTPQQVQAKARCLRCYQSQGATNSGQLVSFVRTNELFVELRDSLPAATTVTVDDPVGDLPPDRLHPAEDIARLELARDADPYTVSLTLAGRPDPNLRYAVVWHSLGDPARQAACLTWYQGRGVVRWATADETMREIPVACQLRGNTLTARVAKRFFPGTRLMLEGYSQQATGRYLNHTTTVTTGDR